MGPARRSLPGGCPEISPDGQRLVYAPRYDIMLSADARGSSVKRLTSGYFPRWLPGGRDRAWIRYPQTGDDRPHRSDFLVAGVGRRRRGTPRHSNRSFDRSVGGSFQAPLKARSAVVVASLTSGRLISRVDLPVGASGLHFSGASVSLVLREKPYDVVGLVANERTVLRRGVLGTGWLADVATWEKGRFITTGQATYSLSIKDSEGAERVIATSSWFGRLSSTADGSAVFEHQLSHGPIVVAYYDPRIKTPSPHQQRSERGEGTQDPLIMPSGQQFAFIDRTGERMLRLCSIRSPDECRTILQDPGLESLSGVSPVGDRLAFVTRDGLRVRLRSVSLVDGLTTDLARSQ